MYHIQAQSRRIDLFRSGICTTMQLLNYADTSSGKHMISKTILIKRYFSYISSTKILAFFMAHTLVASIKMQCGFNIRYLKEI